MSDPLEHRPDMSALKFAKLHSPKMKSVYWRHFGFPTNEDDRIITKQNVVCILCNKVLTNHGNTTNLRAHLQHRHKEAFDILCLENGIRIPPRKMTPVKKERLKYIKKEERELERVRVKIKSEHKAKDEQREQEESSSNACIDANDQEMLYETLVPMTYDDDEGINAESFEKMEMSGGRKNDGDDIDNKPAANYHIIEELDPYQLQDALVAMLVQDLQNVDTLYDSGMTRLIRTLSSVVAIPPEKKIVAIIKEQHSDKLTTLADQIKVHSQLNAFSLGFEIWSNVEHKHFLSIFYNYATGGPEYSLLNRLYGTFEYNKYTSIEAIFEEFNLQNCTVAVVSYDYDDYLKHFLRNKNIPIILSYEVTIDKCLRNVFALSPIAAVIDEVKDVIMRYTSEIASKDVEVPTVSEDFPWTYYELLKFFSETVSWPDDMDHLVTTAKTIADTLATLAVTLDTLKGEEIPHSSMLSPITSKILTKKLSVSQADDELVATIKQTITVELQKHVISDDHLTIAALLDPRFHRLTDITNFSNLLKILQEKFNKVGEMEGFGSAVVGDFAEKDVKPNMSTPRKSNLEIFFDIQEVPNPTAVSEENNVEGDLKRYRNDVYVSLDESPFLWWNKVGSIYPALKPLAALYQCVPCVVNMNFKKPIQQQIYEYHKRYMLSGSLVDAILFLHHNNTQI